MVLIKQLKGYKNYSVIINKMEKIVKKIKVNQHLNDQIWLLEHKDVFTAGRSLSVNNLKNTHKIPVISSNRGGQMTYHGPGQLIIYFMLNIKKRKIGLIDFINKIEELIIKVFKKNKVILYQKKEKNRGLWIKTKNGKKKVVFIGLRYSGGVIYHGLSINFNTDLEKFRQITPCGLNVLEITSLKEQKIKYSYFSIKEEIKKQIALEFGDKVI